MSEALRAFVKDFLCDQVSPSDFVDQFMSRWKEERDSGELLADSDGVSEFLSSVFCLADLFNPETDRLDYELDECQLKRKVDRLAKNLK